jgi:hypothetical protein
VLNDFQIEYEIANRKWNRHLVLPARTPTECLSNIQFLGERFIQDPFFGNDHVGGYVLTALSLADDPHYDILMSEENLREARRNAINGFALLGLTREVVYNPQNVFANGYDPEDVIADQQEFLRSLRMLEFNERDLILTLAPVTEVAKGDKILLGKKLQQRAF